MAFWIFRTYQAVVGQFAKERERTENIRSNIQINNRSHRKLYFYFHLPGQGRHVNFTAKNSL